MRGLQDRLNADNDCGSGSDEEGTDSRGAAAGNAVANSGGLFARPSWQAGIQRTVAHTATAGCRTATFMPPAYGGLQHGRPLAHYAYPATVPASHQNAAAAVHMQGYAALAPYGHALGNSSSGLGHALGNSSSTESSALPSDFSSLPRDVQLHIVNMVRYCLEHCFFISRHSKHVNAPTCKPDVNPCYCSSLYVKSV